MNRLKQKPKILVVDDKPENLYTLEKLLTRLEVDVAQTTTGTEALALTLQHDFCLAIVDVRMPEMDGYELVELLRSSEITETLPVIFVSAILSDEYYHRKGYEAGAVDFLSKPFVPEILLSKVKVFVDLYQQRIQLQELQQAEAQRVQQLAKLSAEKDQFFASVSAELQTPFNTLLNDSHLMFTEREQLPQEQIWDMADRIYSSAGTIHNLVETLMTWSSMQRGHMRYPLDEVNLRDLAHKMVKLYRDTAARKNIELINDIEEEIFVCGDEIMLEAIISNLLANALKFTLSGGWVKLSARSGNSTSSRQSNFVEVCVADMGVGISQADQAKLFRIDKPHSTLGTAKEKGAGLGLIMCKEMVEYHRGRIWVESTGRGTTVKFTVPVADLSGCDC